MQRVSLLARGRNGGGGRHGPGGQVKFVHGAVTKDNMDTVPGQAPPPAHPSARFGPMAGLLPRASARVGPCVAEVSRLLRPRPSRARGRGQDKPVDSVTEWAETLNALAR